MAEVVPAIIAKDFGELKEKIKLVEPYAKSVQIDVMDGIFVSNITWNNPEELKNIKTGLEIEAHLMVENVEKEIERWINSGVKRILVHVEAIKDDLRSTIYDLRNKCKKHGVELGVVLNLETPIDVFGKICHCESADRRTKQSRGITARLLRHFTPRNDVCVIDVVQLMSIARIGAHGQPFDERVIPKIKALRQKYPSVKIEADGGINMENAKKIAEAGADILVVGSAIFNSGNIVETIKKLKESLK